MSYEIARRQLEAILTSVVPSLSLGDLPKRFTRAVIKEGHVAVDRNFFFEVNDDGVSDIDGPYVPDIIGQPVMIVPMVLLVAYRNRPQDRPSLDVLIESDRYQISKALLNQAVWGDKRDGIMWLKGSGDSVFPSKRIVEDDIILLQFNFELAYR